MHCMHFCACFVNRNFQCWLSWNIHAKKYLHIYVSDSDAELSIEGGGWCGCGGKTRKCQVLLKAHVLPRRRPHNGSLLALQQWMTAVTGCKENLLPLRLQVCRSFFLSTCFFLFVRGSLNLSHEFFIPLSLVDRKLMMSEERQTKSKSNNIHS